MPALRNDIDTEGLLEYSVVYTDRSLNHMSQKFQQVMRDLSTTLKQVYQADAVAIVPGSGTYAMEAVARQLAQNKTCLVIRNGFFSFRWSQIFEMARLPQEEIVLKARQIDANHPQSPFTPIPVEEAVAAIRANQPQVVFAAHTETAAGMILPDDYIRQIAAATHEVGGLLVLDCIASGCIWVDMKDLGVDILISAPQKGWSAPPCCGMVMMNETAKQAVQTSQSNSFAMDLKKWLEIMQAYENGGHAYHATMPTNALVVLRDVMQESAQIGFEQLKAKQQELGERIRDVMKQRGVVSVAADEFAAPGVVVCFTDDDNISNTKKFIAEGVQIAGGVPLKVDEPASYKSFRIGLFGLDKLEDIERSVQLFSDALDKVLAQANA
ncbi:MULTISPECIES: aminotransferase class V-fold PLP-dependent enzyme [Vitreoscilla]|uniref:Aminotransferase class V-fold PLP-dependent enzyme n=1 Tax=Vitreoscilla stercoraria TaxID=61 RepID=A0ABY4E7U7_VITST|nr:MULTISPECIES: aminotransferase class V-fold PLP-dependent enzyme [Vitreoscilla]AUZ04440.1 class V aminotransferase [Vitreoscilla sp. C1]UOO91839.1 aminotransferase class V-fold PLP-dependent enzyme [Vitreoscilla stercoraria]